MYINIYIWCILYTYILDIHYISMKCIQIYIYIYIHIRMYILYKDVHKIQSSFVLECHHTIDYACFI